MSQLRMLLSLEAALFWTAVLIHAGVLAQGYEHRDARVAESVIGTVLVLGLIAGVVAQRRARLFGQLAQGFALLGTMVGVFVMIIGIGPQSILDAVLHASMVALLVTGLVVVARRGQRTSPRHG